MKICQISLFSGQPSIWQIVCLIIVDTNDAFDVLLCIVNWYYYFDMHYILHRLLLFSCNLIIVSGKTKNIYCNQIF